MNPIWRGVRAVALVASLTIAACGGATARGVPSSSTSPAPARGAGGTLRLLWWQAPTILNSHLAQGTKDYDAASLILEPLAKMGPDGTPVPFLANDIPTVANGEISKDLKTVTWKLKKDVTWSDGTPFTSDDVVFTYQYLANKDTAATDSSTADNAAKVEAVDPHTVRITWKEPNPNPYQLFVTGLGNILQKKQFEPCIGAKAKDCPANNAPVGTGPYKLTQFKPGDVVTYAINEKYREKNKPYFKEVQLKGVDDATTAARAVFQTGDADYAWNLQVEANVLSGLMKGGKGDLVTADSANVERLLLNRADPNAPGGQRSEPTTKHPFFSDLAVRKAFAMAVDRDTIASQLYGETGSATCDIVTAPPAAVSTTTKTLDVCKHDLAAANKLLDDAGWRKGPDGVREKNGQKMSVLFQTSVNPLRQKEQQIVKSQWEQLGVKVELKSVPAKVFFGSDAGNPDTAAHFYADVEMFTNGASDPSQLDYLVNWVSDQIASKSNQWHGNNYERYSNKAYDDLFAKLKTETDAEKHDSLVKQMNDMLVSDVVVIPLVARKSPVAGAAKDLKGLKPDPWESDLWNIADWYKSAS